METFEFINALMNSELSTESIFMIYILINLLFRLKSDADRKLNRLLELSENINFDLNRTARSCKPENMLLNLDSIVKKLEMQPITAKDVSNIEAALKENNDKLNEIKSILYNGGWH